MKPSPRTRNRNSAQRRFSNLRSSGVPLWEVRYYAGIDIEDGGAAVWKIMTSGRSRLRACIVLIIGTLARPEVSLRLSWRGGQTMWWEGVKR